VDRLVVSATVRVVDRVHRHTADGWVDLSSRLGAVVSRTGLHQRFLGAAVSAENTDGGSASCWQILQRTAWKADADLVTHASLKDSRVAAGASELTTVSRPGLDITDWSPLRDLGELGYVTRTQTDIVAKGQFLTDGDSLRSCDVGSCAIIELDARERSGVSRAVN